MSEIVTQVEIDATAERVWEVLTNFAAYHEWNSVFWPEKGEVKSGAELRVCIQMPGWLKITFRPTVLKAEPCRELSWIGRLPIRLLEGKHSFTIVPLERNRVRFVHREVYAGILVPIYMRVMGGWLRRAYEKMNREFKLRAERALA